MGNSDQKDTLKVPTVVSTTLSPVSRSNSVSPVGSIISTEDVGAPMLPISSNNNKSTTDDNTDSENMTKKTHKNYKHNIQNKNKSTNKNLKVTVQQLGELHDPKSLHVFNNIFDNDYNNLFTYLDTDAKNGININDTEDGDSNGDSNGNGGVAKININDRIEIYGENKLPEKNSKKLWQLLWEGLQDRTMIILTIAAIVSLALGLYETFGQPDQYDPEGKKIPKVDWVEGVAILIAIFVVVSVGAVNDYQKELQFKKLNSKKEDRLINVIRNGGETHVVSIYDLMVGDIISLQTGDIVPADAILISGECECDESALTGESDTIEKWPLKRALQKFNSLEDQSLDITTDSEILDPMLISGSQLLSGLGTAVVTAVGVNSVHGKTMQSLQVEPEVTPLQERLTKLADNISLFGLMASLLLFIVLFIRFCINISPDHIYHSLPSSQKGSKFMNIFIVSIALIAVAIPEGLPLAVTLALAFSTTRMSKDGNLVRVLRSCETMGSATCVCSDKTGTLTENKMSVVKGFINGQEFDDNHSVTVSSMGNENNSDNSMAKKTSKEIKGSLSSNLVRNLLANITLNSTAFENKDYIPENEQFDNPFKHLHLQNIHSPHFHHHDTLKKNDANKSKDKVKNKKQSDLVHSVVNANPEPFIGSKTETALLSFAKKFLDMKSLNSYRDDPSNSSEVDIAEIVETIPFESSRKWSGIVVQLKSNPNIYRLYVKGASEIVLSKCGYSIVGKKISEGSDENENESFDELEIINDQVFKEISENKIDYLANQALRTISLAHKDFDISDYTPNDDDNNTNAWPPKELQDEKNPMGCNPDLLLSDSDIDRSAAENNGMVLDALVGVQDPLRAGVRDSVEQCARAGVTVRMVTGDNLKTARAIALNASILSEKEHEDPDCSMEGVVFRKLSDDEKLKVIPKLKVLARSSPEDKRVLVENLKKMGEIVAVTGDGTNDAPALKLADVGFSMGIAGTEVAREASDIILMTDDFSAIVKAIKWGRCVAISIKKFVQFQLTVNFTAVILTFVSAVASKSETSVLTAVQLLWVNLIMDTLAALALATDKPDDNILDRKPKGRKAPLISPAMWKMILIQSSVQIIITFLLHFKGGDFFFGDDITSHQETQISSLTFNTFVWMQFFNLIVTRKFDEADGISNIKDRITLSNLNFFSHFFSNYYFIGILLIIGGFQVLIMYVGGAAFSIARQTPAMWATAILCGLVSLLVGVVVRIIPDEWVTRFFPTKLANKLEYYIFLGFLHKDDNKQDDLESSHESASSSTHPHEK